MKPMQLRTALAAVLVFTAAAAFAQQPAGPTGHVFTDVKVNACTPPKDQNRTYTCWSFSGLSLVQSDLIRRGKGEHDLSEMWIARHAWPEKAEKYVRMHGNLTLAPGGNFHDVFNVISRYGIVPDEAYRGLEYGMEKHVHKEMDALLKAYAETVVTNPNGSLSTAWKKGFEGILDAYLGTVPEKFTYRGREYTPQSFAASLGFDPNDYVTLTSYTHHPFYAPFVLEIPDNWAWGQAYNVPLDELIAVIDGALEQGYTVAWGADVSERGWAFRQGGVALLPETDVDSLPAEQRAGYAGMSEQEVENRVYRLKYPVTEKRVTQALRQRMFDNYQTQDDHGMEIVGLARDQSGRKYYKVKNSYGLSGPYKGYLYVSEPYVRAKTTMISLNKDGVPEGVARKAGIR